jgi:hypothetical protein
MTQYGHDSDLEKLRRLTTSLLDAQRPAYTLRSEVLEIKSILETSAERISDPTRDIAAGETRTRRGLAISPTMASMCVDDFARTVQFVRGMHDAIAEVRKKITSRPVRVLYAGCGPWATLAVPVMSVVPSSDVKFTLLDIHDASIASARALIETLGLSASVEGLVETDACEYSISEHPDILLIEMMRAALESEPQVAVAMHLVHEAPHVLMIPEDVRVALSLVDQSVRLDSDIEVGEKEKTIEVGELFALNKSSIEKPEQFAPTSIQLPDFDPDRYRPMLTTTVRVYGDHVLRGNDSGITLPKPLTLIPAPQPGEVLEFQYEIGERPGLRVKRT